MLWPLNNQNCSSYLRNATNCYRHGPCLAEIKKVVRLGCKRCEVIFAGVSAAFQDSNDTLHGEALQNIVEDVLFKRGEKCVVIGRLLEWL